MNEFLHAILGTDNLGRFAALTVFAFIGMFLSSLLNTTKRDPNSMASPFCFEWKYFWNDNTRRFLAGLIMVYVAIRFTREMLNIEISDFVALCIGFCSDKLAQILKTKTDLLGKQ